MRPLPDGVAIKPGETVELKPEGAHIMFLNLKTSLDADQYVDGSLTFEKAGKIDVEFYVEPAADGCARIWRITHRPLRRCWFGGAHGSLGFATAGTRDVAALSSADIRAGVRTAARGRCFAAFS